MTNSISIQELVNFYTTNMEATKTTDNILILWLLAAAISIVLFVSLAHTNKVEVPTMQWQADSSWVKPWNN